MVLRPAIRRGRNAIENNERKDVILLHFSRQPDGELRCRATDVPAKRSWTVAQAREPWALVVRSEETCETTWRRL